MSYLVENGDKPGIDIERFCADLCDALQGEIKEIATAEADGDGLPDQIEWWPLGEPYVHVYTPEERDDRCFMPNAQNRTIRFKDNPYEIRFELGGRAGRN